MSRGFSKLDPKWKEFSASLRKGVLYVKMPISKAVALCKVWDTLSQMFALPPEVRDPSALFELLRDEGKASIEYGISSVFYSTNVEKCEKDIAALKMVAPEDESGILINFCDALEAGLRSENKVDWITRTGGPTPTTFEALQPELTLNEEIALDDFFPDSRELD